VVPILVLEMVSETMRGEYDEKMDIYARLEVLYYVVYNPEWGQKRQQKRQQKRPFEVYKLNEGEYQLQQGEPYWMPEVGLGIGRCQMMSDHELQEQLAWFDPQGDRYLSEAETERQRADLERQRAEAEQQRREQLEEFLRSQGFDPNQLPKG
jgi:hypothetical protein